jgi:hypothetical protein
MELARGQVVAWGNPQLPGETTVQQRRMTDVEQRMLDDLDWAEKDPEVQQHHGKFVVVYQKRILAVGTDRMALVQHAAEQVGVPWQHLLVVVVPSPEMCEIPH